MSTWLITGCSTGLGRELALAVLKRGDNAVVTARNAGSVEDITAGYPDSALALALDVTDRGQVAGVVREATDRFGAIDVLVNNAGHGFRSAVEEATGAELEELFGTNFFGAVALIQAVLPGMRARRSGAIVNLSSIAGLRSAPGSGYYSASKSALESVSDALRKEVGPLGIKVLIVEPGGFRTDFAGRSLLQSAAPIADYVGTAGKRRKENDTSDGKQPGDPAKFPAAIFGALEAERTPLRLLLGTDALTAARTELQARLAEFDTWETTTVSTDYPA